MEWSPWNNELGKFFSYITPNDWTRIDIDSTILSSGSAAQRDSHEEKSTDNKQRISKASVFILQKYMKDLKIWIIDWLELVRVQEPLSRVFTKYIGTQWSREKERRRRRFKVPSMFSSFLLFLENEEKYTFTGRG